MRDKVLTTGRLKIETKTCGVKRIPEVQRRKYTAPYLRRIVDSRSNALSLYVRLAQVEEQWISNP